MISKGRGGEAGDRGQDLVGRFSPVKGFGPLVVGDDELTNSALQLPDTAVRAALDSCNLPTQVCSILNTCVHALASDRRVDMRSITGKKDISGTVMFRLPVIDVERSHPLRAQDAALTNE